MDSFEEELKHDFLEESCDLIADAESAFLRLEHERDDSELMNEIFRLAHNLKGTSRAVGFSQLAEFTHIAENLILKLKEGELKITDHVVSTLLEFKDSVQEMVEGLKGNFEATFDLDMIILKLEATTNGDYESDKSQDEEIEEVPNETSFEEEVVEDSLVAELSNVVDEIAQESTSNNEVVEDVVEIENNVVEIDEKVTAKTKKPTQGNKGQSKASNTDESIRVNLSKINNLNNIIGELVILQTVLEQRRFSHIEDGLSNKSIGMMGKLFKEVQDLSMSLRMLPMKNTFQKMNRIVRDTSNALSKDVKLHLVGEDTEVDKTVLEKLGDPLTHIVRNAVDHGLETPEERKAAGKESPGNVELLAFHEGSNLVIQITDDGKGIDPDIIRRKAIEKGVIDQHSKMTDQEVIQLIFNAGFSTKEQVTEVSGRGVGMDVVKTNIESLGGEVKLMSKLGEGSSLKIILPLTLAVIEGIVISSAEEKFIIPLTQVHELTRADRAEIETFTNIADLFKLRGEVIPLFYISKKLGGKPKDDTKQIVIVVRGAGRVFGVVIDDVINQQQIVIKNLGEDIRGMKGIMGSAIMGDGKPALIVDLFELFKDDLKSSRGYEKLRRNQDAA